RVPCQTKLVRSHVRLVLPREPRPAIAGVCVTCSHGAGWPCAVRMSDSSRFREVADVREESTVRPYAHRMTCIACLLIGMTASPRLLAQEQADDAGADDDTGPRDPATDRPKVTPPKLKRGVELERPADSELASLW